MYFACPVGAVITIFEKDITNGFLQLTDMYHI